MDIRINELSDRELLENIFYQNLLINKKLNAFIEINDEVREMFNEIEDAGDFHNTTQLQIIKTILSYKEDKCILNENDIIAYKKTFKREPII